MPQIELINVSKHYITGKEIVRALQGINLEVQKGEFIAIVGPSGSGKTTLLNIIGCIDLPTSGEVKLENQLLNNRKPYELTLLRRYYFGFIFQSFNLIPVLTVYENVELSLDLKYKNLRKHEKLEKIMEILEAVGLADKRNRKVTEISQGEQQRVSIARSLVKDPKCVLADEPTANLDSRTGASIVELMKRLNEEKSITFIFSTHDPLIIEYAKRIVFLRDGMIVHEKL